MSPSSPYSGQHYHPKQGTPSSQQKTCWCCGYKGSSFSLKALGMGGGLWHRCYQCGEQVCQFCARYSNDPQIPPTSSRFSCTIHTGLDCYHAEGRACTRPTRAQKSIAGRPLDVAHSAAGGTIEVSEVIRELLILMERVVAASGHAGGGAVAATTTSVGAHAEAGSAAASFSADRTAIERSLNDQIATWNREASEHAGGGGAGAGGRHTYKFKPTSQWFTREGDVIETIAEYTRPSTSLGGEGGREHMATLSMRDILQSRLGGNFEGLVYTIVDRTSR